MAEPSRTELSRRAFTRGTLGSLLTYSLLETLSAADAFGEEIKPITAPWLKEVNDISVELKGQPLEQLQWQQQIEGLMKQVDLPELLMFIDFEKLTANIPFRDKGERSLRPRLPKVEGLPTNLVFGHQVFALQKDRSVVPHGHNNMATAFLILKGDFHGRHYDRLEDGDDHMIIKPTIDRAFTAAEYSSISDYKDNVHWFKATSETAFIYNIHVLNLDTGEGKRGGRVYIDPAGEELSGGRIKARKASFPEVHKLYG